MCPGFIDGTSLADGLKLAAKFMSDSSKQEGPRFLATPEPAVGVWRQKAWRIIFLSDTPAGRFFDVVLLWAIGISVLVVMLESVDSLRASHGSLLLGLEWLFTIAFTIEYLVRLCVVRYPSHYARSFLGVIDLLSFVPAYLELLEFGSHYLMILRVLRMLRLFRVLKLSRYTGEASILINALRASREKIAVFLFVVMTLVCVEGTIMYLLESSVNRGFANIPQSIYWAIVTLTTVGYGDVAPVTVLGKVMASLVMLTGFAILAVPTGVVTAELGREISRQRQDHRRCSECGWEGHDARARFCHQCGTRLP